MNETSEQQIQPSGNRAVKLRSEIDVGSRAASGAGEQLHRPVEREFLNVGEQEKNDRLVLAKMESGFIRRLMEFQRE
jgi:F-type H+-transporting ATPase subunit epsilon